MALITVVVKRTKKDKEIPNRHFERAKRKSKVCPKCGHKMKGSTFFPLVRSAQIKEHFYNECAKCKTGWVVILDE